MYFKEDRIGKGKPTLAIMACLHGDEIAGKKVIEHLKKIELKKGAISLFIGNSEAITKKKRFIEKDLNRSFPGKKNGVLEEKIAYALRPRLGHFDFVVDLHTTNSKMDSLAIVTKLNKKHKDLLKKIPINKVALIGKKVFGGNDMISYCKVGVSLEYGPDKSGRNYKKILKDIKTILSNLNFIEGKKKVIFKKSLYEVSGVYQVMDKFEQSNKLKDFRLIHKGQAIGQINSVSIKSDSSFYPLFLGKGRYPKTLALISSKKSLTLK